MKTFREVAKLITERMDRGEYYTWGLDYNNLIQWGDPADEESSS